MPAVNLINAVPAFVSQDEYKNIVTSTPNSFNDIPPVIRHKEDNVSVVLEPPVEGFTAEDGTNGSLYVLTSVLAFISNTGRGFQIEYPSITLHAVSRSNSNPSIYCQLDESGALGNGSATPAAANGVNGDEAGEEEDYTDMRELSIIPPSPDSLEPIFEALSQCAALHPDPLSDDDGLEDAVFDGSSPFEVFTGDDDQELSEVGRAALAHLESIIYDPHDPDMQNAEDDADHEGEVGEDVTEPTEGEGVKKDEK